MKSPLVAFCLCLLAGAAGAGERALSFDEWVSAFRLEALGSGIRGETFDRAFAGVRFNAGVMVLNEEQPEFNKPIWEYLDSAASEQRLRDGAAALVLHKTWLAKAEKTTGVPRQVIAAIWGLESNYGKILGDFYAIEALATLAYSGPRKEYGREQLLAALKILDEGDIAPGQMTGSWAGALGHTQFIPTTYLAYAVDGDGDGKRDLWNSLADVFMSTGKYLAGHGWVKGAPWAIEVKLPENFAYENADLQVEKTLAEWMAEGVKRANGKALTATRGAAKDMTASVVLPAGHRGAAFLAFKNFKVILTYNNSTAYGLGVSYLANLLDGAPALRASWPREERMLARDERVELQSLLSAKGFDLGEADGIIGWRTRNAIRAYQKSTGEVPDGFATVALLERLRAGGR